MGEKPVRVIEYQSSGAREDSSHARQWLIVFYASLGCVALSILIGFICDWLHLSPGASVALGMIGVAFGVVSGIRYLLFGRRRTGIRARGIVLAVLCVTFILFVSLLLMIRLTPDL